MTERFYCDTCQEYGYVFFDGAIAEVIEGCACVRSNA